MHNAEQYQRKVGLLRKMQKGKNFVLGSYQRVGIINRCLSIVDLLL